MTSAQAAVGRLVVCPTPIGNLQDVTLRVLEALREADVLACEHPRHTRQLLDRHGIDARTLSLNEHNERARSRELVSRIRAGQTVALVSDAGTPLVSDPGYALLRDCIAESLPVEVLPGPSAVLTALVASGLPPSSFTFAGFLPRARRELEPLLARSPNTLVAFESPRRLAATLSLLAEIDPERRAAVCRELTKVHEDVRRGSARELAQHYRAHPPRGEIVLVVAAAAAAGARADGEQAIAALRSLVAAGARPRPAAAAVGRLVGLGANELYRELTRAR